MKNNSAQEEKWICKKCGEKLKMRLTKVRYLNGNFEVELPACPICNKVLITEELATGKMLEVEKGLEDK